MSGIASGGPLHAVAALKRTATRLFQLVSEQLILDRLLHHSTTINIKGESYRLKDKKKAGTLGRPRPEEGG